MTRLTTEELTELANLLHPDAVGWERWQAFELIMKQRDAVLAALETSNDR